MSAIRFFEETSYKLRHKNILKKWIVQAIATKGIEMEWLNFIFVDEKRITEINQTHLNHQGPTDVITFQYSKKKEPIEGEVYICTEVVVENAMRFSSSIEQELHRVMIHGVLHLLGYSDKRADLRKSMRSQEKRWLRRLAVLL